MKASQKGMKLNDIRYFRQPRPYTKKRIPKMRLFPDFPDVHQSVISTSKDKISSANNRRSSGKSSGRCLTVHCDQRSREIACISYTSDSEELQDFHHTEENNRNDLCKTSQTSEPKKQISIPQLETKASENNKFEIKLETEKKIQVEIELQVAEKNICVEELDGSVSVTPEVRRKPKEEIEKEIAYELPQVRSNENSSENEKNVWIRYDGIRKIVDFFGNLFGKSYSDKNDNEATRMLETRQFVDRGVNNFSNTAKKNKLHSLVKRREKKSSKYKSLSRRMDAELKRPEDVKFSGLTRQMINTRDTRLRDTLIEHDMRARKLEEENRRYRRILKEKLQTRQMSSPLH